MDDRSAIYFAATSRNYFNIYTKRCNSIISSSALSFCAKNNKKQKRGCIHGTLIDKSTRNRFNIGEGSKGVKLRKYISKGEKQAKRA